MTDQNAFIAAAQIDYDVALAANVAGDAAVIAAEAALATLIVDGGLEISADGSITIENRSPDIGLSPANSGWMTLFGQFFDHGLDLVTKGGNGTVYIPLQPDDPLYDLGLDGIVSGDDGFGADGIFGNADDRAELHGGDPRDPVHRSGDRAADGGAEHHDAVHRPEPDLHLARLASGVPARIRLRTSTASP